MPVTEGRKRDTVLGLTIVAGLAFVLLARPVIFAPVPVSAGVQEVPGYVKARLGAQSGKPVHGIDVSHYQGVIHWPVVAEAGLAFAYMKATDGATYQDPSFSTNIANAADTGLKLGAYHFFEADDEPQQQLANFLSTIRGKPLSLTPMVDVEVKDSQAVSELKQRLSLFLQQVKQATGCIPLVYSYSSFWQSDIGPQFNDYPFWLADYASKPTPPPGVKNWQIWQYSESGTVQGISAPVDMDVMVEGAAGLAQLACDYSGDMLMGQGHD